MWANGCLSRDDAVSAIVTRLWTDLCRCACSRPRSTPILIAAAISPAISGYLLSLSTFGSPLLIGGILKIAYDLTLLIMFRHIRPPEESAT